MRRLVLRFALALTLVGLVSACAGDAVTPTPALYGWRSAGLILPDANSTGGLRRLVNIGNTLFAMDSYEPPNSDPMAQYRVTRYQQWRMWKGSVGSDHWEQLLMPNGEVPFEWAVVGQKLVVGTEYTGQVYRFDPTNGMWNRFRKPALPGLPDTLPSVEGVGEYNGRIVISIGMNVTGRHQCLLQLGSTDSLASIPCMGTGMNFYNAYQLDGYLYAYQSEWGIARYREGDASWEKLPSARGRTDPTEFEFLSAMSVVNGKLYVGYEWNLGVFRWDDGKWTSVTPKDAQQRMETSHTVKVIAGYRGRLFQAGSEGSGIAMMTPRDSGKVVWGDWKLVDVNWCKIANGCPDQTRAILGIGDTLYATGWSFVAKVPFSDLDKMARPMFLN